MQNKICFKLTDIIDAGITAYKLTDTEKPIEESPIFQALQNAMEKTR